MKSLPLLSNHPRVKRWTAAVVASAIALGVCLASYDNVDAAIRQNRIERLNARIENVYTADYQNMADDKLEQEKSKSAATEDDMFVTEDPYGTNTTSLYVYFKNDDSVYEYYTVHADGYAQLTRDDFFFFFFCISQPTTRYPYPIQCKRTATRISPVTPTSNRNTAKPMNSRNSALFPGKRTPSPSR